MKKLLLITAALIALANPAAAQSRLSGQFMPHQFTFEAATPKVDDIFLSVSYVMRNDSPRAFAFVNITCSVFVGDKLVGSAIETKPNMKAGHRVHGQAIATPISQRPDRAECSAEPQPEF
jgi:hypothetical protein